IEKIKIRTRNRIRRYIVPLFPVKLSDEDFCNVFGCKNKQELLALIREYNKSRFFFDPDKKEEIIEIIKEEYPSSIDQTIRNADEICNHTFDLLGSGKTNLGEEIDWHLDFKSGYRWNPKKYYLGTLDYINLDDESDVKIPWELSRFQHFVTLGKAYWYTEDEKYAREFVDQVESWIEKNPIELGVNWACTMEVAIRAVNWIWGYYFFYNSKSLSNEFQLKFLKNLFLHGRHIMNNLEFGMIRGNHYLSNIVGLIYLGIFFPECKEVKEWLDKGLKALEEEMEFQVYPDGVDFEGSISYHRLVTELFLSPVLLLQKNNINVSERLLKRLEKMIEFTLYYTKPDGTSPIIGDNDDGRLHKLSNNEINDHRYLLSIGSVLFGRKDFKSACDKFNEEAFWLLRKRGLNDFKNLPREDIDIESKAFKNGGFYIMRKDNLYMIIDCGEVGYAGRGGHGHNDTLSFELFARDKTFIIDPGSYVYTASPKWRNVFRSTKYHNTVVVDNEEMNRFHEEDLFTMEFDAIPKINRWVSKEEYDFFDGEHYGYKRLKEPIVHRRQIYFDKKDEFWLIRDLLSGEGKHKFDLYFHFAPMDLELDSETFIVYTKNKEGVNILIIPLEKDKMSVEIQKGFVSYSYGVKVESPVLRYSINDFAPVKFDNLIFPFHKKDEILDLRKNIEKAREILNSSLFK
ncbi:MAG: alginate lyase family protein, partial [Methanosarcinales archaeon]